MTIVNADQADRWNSGDEGGHWVANQARYDSMLAPFADLVLEAIGLRPDERVLDVGCGCGATTLAAARLVPQGEAVGIDLSGLMLARARADVSAAGLHNAVFEQGDVQVHPFASESFDAVISRFGVMFFADPVEAFANLRRATRTGGRLAFVCWQPFAANEWLVVVGAALAEHVELPDLGPPDAPGMFAFGDPARTADLLASAGWRTVETTSVHTPILVGGGGSLDEALDFLRTGSMGRTFLADASPETESRAVAAVREALGPHADGSGVRLGAAVWLVEATA